MDADFLSPAITGFYTHAAFNNQYNVAVSTHQSHQRVGWVVG